MAEFNAMDTASFKGVWVFCEQREPRQHAGERDEPKQDHH